MRTIILVTDFSPSALNAANYAAELATAIDADLLLMHVFYLFEGYSEVPALVTAGELENSARESIEKLKNDLQYKHANLNISTEIKRGTLIHELKIVSERVKPYCIVVGSQGASAIDYRFFGSQTVLAMKELEWPVIAVPRGTRFVSVKNIGIACDLENGIDHLPVEGLKKLISDFKASLHILNSSGNQSQKSKILEEASALMDELAPVHHQFHFINSGNNDIAIVDFAEKNNLELLIVLPKKHSLFDKWTNKSYTRKLVLNLHVPVMALHFEKPKK